MTMATFVCALGIRDQRSWLILPGYVLKDRRGDLASDGPSSSDSASDLDNQVSEDESDGLPARKRRKREHGLEHVGTQHGLLLIYQG